MKYLGLCGLSCVFALKCNSFGAESETFAKKHPGELPSQDSI